MPKSYKRKTRRSRSRKGGLFGFGEDNKNGSTTGSSWTDMFASKPTNTYGSTSMGNTYGATGSASMGSMDNGASMNRSGSMGSMGNGASMNRSASMGSMGNGASNLYNTGGRKGKRGMRGGNHSPNMSQTNLASRAAPVSGVQTAHAMKVGGRTRRRHRKSCKKSCRKY